MGTGLQPPPRVLGRYALYDEIASGGMATVHLGRLLGPVGFARTVAIKRLHPQFAKDPDFVSMFLDEARLVARIRHPNVVPTLDVVSTEGELFIVMEYVQGEPLSRLIRVARSRGARIPPAMVTTLMVGVLHGLHAAHEAKGERGELLGIVHRDVSPQNVLVGVDGIARMLDFGVAKAAGRVATTREGQLKGKLAYMAPEQLQGTVSRATDIYAASVVLWEALTGRRLFAGDSEGHTFAKVMQGTSEPPSASAPDVPAVLDALVLRGLSVDPAKRFSTARDMARALEDAMPLLAPSKIGEWVEEAAATALADRAKRVEAIESSSALDVSRLPRPSDGAVQAKPAPPPVVPAAEEAVPTQLSSSSASLPPSPPSMPSPRRRGLPVLLAATLVLAAGVLVAALRRATPASQAPAASPPASMLAASPPPVDSPSSLPSPPVPSSSTAADLQGADASAASAPSPSTSSARAAVAAPRRPSAPRIAPSKPSHCDPPYYFNAQGDRIFKKECL